MLRAAFFGLALALSAGAAQAQDAATLADIRAQLSTLYGDLESLKSELTVSGQLGSGVQGNTALDRLNAIESELQRLTSKAEELEYRINAVVTDGTNRIGDLEFRLCELEPGCDIGALGTTSQLGGGTTTPVTQVDKAPELAVGEQADYAAAMNAFETEDYATAAQLLSEFTVKYPGGPLNQQAHYFRGESYEYLGDMRNAARAYLDAFSANQEGEIAGASLYKLGFSLGAIGQVPDACVTLEQVPIRFPDSDAAADAEAARRNLGCL